MSQSRKVKVAIDLTPLRPGGENGGAKTLVVTLLREFAQCRSAEFEYLLIAETWNYEELRSFEAPNLRCCLQADLPNAPDLSIAEPTEAREVAAVSPPPVRPAHPFKARLKGSLKRGLKRSLGLVMRLAQPILRQENRVVQRLKSATKRRILALPSGAELLPTPPQTPVDLVPQPLPTTRILKDRHHIDLLFCPFSSPHLAEEGLPLVAIAYDLQHLDLPFFFTPEEALHRNQFLRNLVDRADRIICISNFTKQSFIQHLKAEASQLIAVPICIHERLTPQADEVVAERLNKLGLQVNQYLYFPANFWPHKNHRMLLTAYSIYRHRYPDQALDLVFTGALEGPQAELQEVVDLLDYTEYVHFLGFLDEVDLVALWQGCRGLIFPSLYEGFGIPVLEAMWFDKAVACSTVGSLPEVGGEAVIYFDPRKPEEIATAMEQLTSDTELTQSLRAVAQDWVRHFGQRAMAEQYLAIFDEVLNAVHTPTGSAS
ncbi:MAG: glycosyltransferase family 4 protein [Spirulina sp.]